MKVENKLHVKIHRFQLQPNVICTMDENKKECRFFPRPKIDSMTSF